MVDGKRRKTTSSTYLDLSFSYVERQAANDNFAVLWSSLSRTGCGFDSRFRRLDSFLDTTNRCGLWLVTTEVALRLLLAIDDAVQRLIESCGHGERGVIG